MKKLEIINLSVEIENKQILKDINIYVNEGEFVSIVGLSGSGKTSILNSISNILPIKSGEILLNNEKINNKDRQISYMFQKDLLLEYMSVLDNVNLPLVLKNEKKEKALEKSLELLRKFKLENLKNKYPKELSGGERQRVALLRSYNISNNLHLLDEPFSSLDYITKKNIHKWYNDIREKYNISTLLITHDIEEAIILSDRIYVLSKEKSTIISEIVVKSKEKDTTLIEFLNLKEKIIKLLNENGENYD